MKPTFCSFNDCRPRRLARFQAVISVCGVRLNYAVKVCALHREHPYFSRIAAIARIEVKVEPFDQRTGRAA